MSKDRPHYCRERDFWDTKGAQAYGTLSPHDQMRLRSWIGWLGNGIVLDIGGGSGMISRLLSDRPATECICVDISHALLAHCPVTAVQADALRLPFANNIFHLIVAAAFVHHLPGRERELLSECYRVLAPGGRIVGYDPNAICLQNRLFMTDASLRLKLFSPDERPVNPAELASAAEAVGFKNFTYHSFSFHNLRLTVFEFIQRYLINPFAVGPLKRYFDRWFFWQAYK